jgi:phasin family protein
MIMTTKRPVPDPARAAMMMPSFLDVESFTKMQSEAIGTVVEANRIFATAAQAIVNCQADMMRDCVEQMTRAFSGLNVRGDPGELASREGAAVQALFEKTAAHVRDIAEVVGKSNAEVIELVNGRMRSLADDAASSRNRK